MPKVKQGDSVSAHYVGTLEDGTVFSNTEKDEPLKFVIGDGTVLQGFEEALIGMSPGETRNVTFEADKGYGPHHDDLIRSVPRSQLPEGFDPEENEYLDISQEGHDFVALVIETSDEDITLDANHPLAGKALTFEITLEAIE
jgi:peptidylprolyl isomerase